MKSFPLAALALAATAALAADPEPQVIVVTVTRHAMLAAEAPASLAVVPRARIEARAADNLLDALRAEPGVTLQARAIGGRKALSLRGMDSRHTLFLVDGRRVAASDGVLGNADFAYDAGAADDIERIEVVRGPMSVLYGSEALGGVVNVITRQPGDAWRFGGGVEGSLAAGDRGGDGHRLWASADGPMADGLKLRASVAETAIDAVVSPADPRISELEGRTRRDGRIGLGWQPAAGHVLDLEHREGREQRRADARERFGARRYHETVNEVERRLTTLTWDAVFGDATTRLRAYRGVLAVTNQRTRGVPVNVPQALTDAVLEGQARLPVGAHALTGGFEARDETLDDPGLPGGAFTARHRAAFVQDEWDAGALTVTAGLRRDEHSMYGGEWSPRAYAVWRVAPAWTVKAGASHGFKAPNLKQIVPGARAEGPNTFLGNPELTPERADAVEAGVAWTAGAAQAQAVVFEQRVDDLIEVVLVAPGTAPGTGTYTYRNIAQARLRGLELSAVQRLGAGFEMAGSYGYLDARDADGRRLDKRPRHTLGARLDWKQGPWRSGLQADHMGSQLLPSTTVGAPSERAPGYTLWGAHVALKLGYGLEATLAVTNFGNLRLQDRSGSFSQIEAPRTLRLALRGRW